MQELKIGDFVDFMGSAASSRGGLISLSDSARWYCAVVRAGRHRRAEFELQRLGFRTFYPRTRRWISHARVKRAEERPILGQYLFVEIDHPTQSFDTVSAVFDVGHFVSSLGKPSAFPSRLIEGFIGRYLAGEWDQIEGESIPVGARIRIMEGEFQDALATVISGKGRKLDCKILGDTIVTRVHQCSVRAA